MNRLSFARGDQACCEEGSAAGCRPALERIFRPFGAGWRGLDGLVRWPESCHRRILEKRADLGLPRRRERQRWLQSSYLRAENTAGRFARSESPVLTRPVVHVALTRERYLNPILF